MRKHAADDPIASDVDHDANACAHRFKRAGLALNFAYLCDLGDLKHVGGRGTCRAVFQENPLGEGADCGGGHLSQHNRMVFLLDGARGAKLLGELAIVRAKDEAFGLGI